MALRDRGMAFRHLNTLFSVGVIGELTDAQLLERFTSRGDETAEPAFRALVERHGPMVLRVCRAVLRNPEDADDAFQATFLVLLHRADSIWVRDSLGPWLHQVAHRTASCARKASERRRRYELRSAERAIGSYESPDRDDLEGVIQDELGRLPGRYREAVVLCLLEGLTPDQAARHLRCPVGTVHSRLARGRELLRSRLTRRGVTAPAGLLTVAWTQKGHSALIPSTLADSTVRLVFQVAAGQAALKAAAPPSAIALAGIVLRAMLTTKITAAAATLAVVGALGIGGVVLARQGQKGPVQVEAAERSRVDEIAHSVPFPEPKASSSRVSRTGRDAENVSSRRTDPDPLAPTKTADATPPVGPLVIHRDMAFRPPSIVSEMALSPDEKTLLTAGAELIAWDVASGEALWRVVEDDAYHFRAPAAASGMRALAFATDGSRFYTPAKRYDIVEWEVATGRSRVIKISSSDDRRPLFEGDVAVQSIDISPDGLKLALGYTGGIVICDRTGKVLCQVDDSSTGSFRMGTNGRPPGRDHLSMGRFSPEGRVLAVVMSDRPEEIRLCDPRTGMSLRSINLASRLVSLAFSPDGGRIAASERDNAVRLYEVGTGRRLWSHTADRTDVHTSAIAFSPDGKVLAACATDHRIHLLDPVTGEETGALADHLRYPWSLAFTSNSRLLYSSGWDRMIRRWDVTARKPLSPAVGRGASGAFPASPDG